MLTCSGFNNIRVTLDLFDDGVHVDDVGNPWSQSRDEIGIFGVRNLNLGYRS